MLTRLTSLLLQVELCLSVEDQRQLAKAQHVTLLPSKSSPNHSCLSYVANICQKSIDHTIGLTLVEVRKSLLIILFWCEKL